MTDTPNRPPLWEAMDRVDRNIKLSAEQSDWPRYIKAAENGRRPGFDSGGGLIAELRSTNLTSESLLITP